MVVHSTVQNRRLLDVACGGGHRSYAINSLEEVFRWKVVLACL